MKSSTSEIVWEYITHWTMCLFILAFCGCFMPAFLIILGCGNMLVDTLHAPRGTLDYVEAKIMYGSISYVAIVIFTKAWLIRGCIEQWQDWLKQHHVTIDRMKYGPAYFRRG